MQSIPHFVLNFLSEYSYLIYSVENVLSCLLRGKTSIETRAGQSLLSTG
ncbi:hypothetical protein PDIG_81550 [Penicillium digitatum PHI26]|uniref:Uncharacterized protein n=2 Tax=Penicillium digitatum TaxID=36651 RepID=K9FT83_PEND2|nr:hypothetical protein PDIP_29910 [Penicillium digitatum Pd1]EKV05958.1 hypothetical protein PDIG_81550 [Penicillium digitatum PHI26]EKV17726.1 hypothetical protein PDIP_29910 [Penicillium digitatum Pd1]